ncbi:Rho-GAP domain-containing protein [Entamoeba marina]
MDSFMCFTPDDLHEWLDVTNPKLSSHKKLFTNLIKSFQHISSTSDTLFSLVSETVTQFETFSQFYANGLVSETVRGATNKMKALKGTLLDVKNTFALATETLKTTEKNVFPIISTIKKICNEMVPKKPIDACALCSVHGFNFIQTTRIDMYLISSQILFDLKRLTSTESYTLDELRVIKDSSVPRLREDLKNTVKAGLETIANQTIQQMLEHDCRSQYELPYHLGQMFQYLYQTGYLTTGIFRLSGREDTVLLYSKYPALIHYNEESAILISSALKRILRDLPEPIIPFDAKKEIIEATRIYDQQLCDKVKEVVIEQFTFNDNPHINSIHINDSTPKSAYLLHIRSILSKLPIASTIIRYFVELSIKISNGPSLMTIPNLAICLTPCLFSGESSVDVSECGFANLFFEELVNNNDLMFNNTNKIYSTARNNVFSELKSRSSAIIPEREQKKYLQSRGLRDTLSPTEHYSTSNPDSLCSPVSGSPTKTPDLEEQENCYGLEEVLKKPFDKMSRPKSQPPKLPRKHDKQCQFGGRNVTQATKRTTININEESPRERRKQELNHPLTHPPSHPPSYPPKTHKTHKTGSRVVSQNNSN